MYGNQQHDRQRRPAEREAGDHRTLGHAGPQLLPDPPQDLGRQLGRRRGRRQGRQEAIKLAQGLCFPPTMGTTAQMALQAAVLAGS